MWDRNVPSDKYGFAGMLTVPRSISARDGRVLSSTIYPPIDADGFELTVKADSCQYERADIALNK